MKIPFSSWGVVFTGKLVEMAGPLCNLGAQGRFANRQVLTAVGPVLVLLALLALTVLTPGECPCCTALSGFYRCRPQLSHCEIPG